MRQIEKRIYDNRLYDLLAINCLRPGETITAVTSVTADDPSLVFGPLTFNTLPISYVDGSSYPAGTVIQARISGGTLPAGKNYAQTTVRARFVTTIDPQVEGVFQLIIRG